MRLRAGARLLPFARLDYGAETVSGIQGIHHVKLAMPPGGEDDARTFYAGALGIAETAKPPHLAIRGGCWFEDGSVRIHLGVNPDFAPARKAHPALVVRDLVTLAARLEASGHPPTADQPLEGYDRLYVDDPFGNRIELMKPW